LLPPCWAFVAYGVLHQDSFLTPKTANLILMALEAPSVPWAATPGSICSCASCARRCAPCGIGTFTAAELASGLCNRGRGVSTRTARPCCYGLDRQRAWLAAALLAANPPAWFLRHDHRVPRTVAGPFACLSFLAMHRDGAAAPAALSAAACGASRRSPMRSTRTGFALPGLLLPCFLVLTRGTDRRSPARRLARPAGARPRTVLIAGRHELLVRGSASASTTVAAPWQDLVRIAQPRGLHLFPLVLWREWIAAHVPALESRCSAPS
jgi:hypothetical protein